MGLISRESIDEVRRANDIVEVINAYVPLQKRGASFWACCPFHDEKTPSFSVHAVRQTYKCFGCGEFGNVIDFLIKHEKLDFPEATEKLAQRAGVTLRYEGRGPTTAERSLRARALEILMWAQRGFVGNLERTPEALAYLDDRGLGGEVAADWGIGYAPDSWDRLTNAARKHFKDDEALEATGLARRKDDGGWYDFFRGRVTFPIRDQQGRIVGFGARVLDPDAKTQKYVNSAEGLLFHKSKLLYGIDRLAQSRMLKSSGRVLLMEGYTDVIAAHQAGFDNAVAPLGTALTRDQLGLLRRYGAGVTLVLDGDEAGLKAAERGVEVALEAGVDATVAVITDAKDPFDLLQKGGAAALQTVLDKARDAFDFKVDLVRSRFRFDRPVEAEQALKELARTAAQADSDSLVEMYTRKVARLLDVQERAVFAEVGEHRAQKKRAEARTQGADRPAPQAGASDTPRMNYEREILRRLFEHPHVLPSASEILYGDAFSAPGLRSLYREFLNAWDEHGELVPGSLLAHLDNGARDELERVLEFAKVTENQARDLEEEQKLVSELQKMAEHAKAGANRVLDLATLRQSLSAKQASKRGLGTTKNHEEPRRTTTDNQ